MLSSFSEIGSEYWIDSIPETLRRDREGVYCLSGRTAIDLILQDILRKRRISSVAMPAWCCDSMIAPFAARGLDVQFYDYGQDEFQNTPDVFYLTNYFGYESALPLKAVNQMKERGCIVLYDRTHSFLMDDGAYRELSDYSFASIRKWMGVVDGAAVEGIGAPDLKECPFVSVKERAMRDKFLYLTGIAGVQKDDFLLAFNDFNHHLAADYRNYRMDDLSYSLYKQADFQSMKRLRRNNAAYIHEHLQGVRFLYELSESAVPLFVPVLFENEEQRNAVRKGLIDNKIYCPIHWPRPSSIPTDHLVNDIVNRELSLICDQRYGLEEIKREIETINQLL